MTKTFVPALLHQLSRTGSPIHTENFRSSAAPPTVKDRFSNSHRRLSLQRCSTNCQGQVLKFTPKLSFQRCSTNRRLSHQRLSFQRAVSSENFHSATVKDKFSTSPLRLSFQRCSSNCSGQVLQFTPKTFAPALLHQLSRTGSQIQTIRKLSLQRCSTNCQGRDLIFIPKTFVPALLHQLSRTSSPIHTEDFRSSAAPPTVKDRFSNSHRRLSLQRCSTNCQGQVLQFTPKTFSSAAPTVRSPKNFRSSAAPPTLQLTFWLQRCSTNCQRQVFQFTPKTFAPALLHQLNRRLSLQRCSTNCQGQVLQFTPKTFAPALLHQLSRTGSPIHTEDFRSSAAPPTVKDRISNSHRRLSLQRCSTNCQGQGHRRLSFQRCSTNCQGQILQFHRRLSLQSCSTNLSETGSPIRTEDFHSSAAQGQVLHQLSRTRFSNSHRRLSFQRCSTNCQGQVLHRRLSFQRCSKLLKTRSPIHRRLSFQRCSTNCQGQDLQFTPKTFVPALLHQLTWTGSPIHTEDFRSSAAPPTVIDRMSRSHRKLSFQRCSANCQGQVLQFTPKTFAPALHHQLSRTGSPIHTEDFRSSAATPTIKDRISN